MIELLKSTSVDARLTAAAEHASKAAAATLEPPDGNIGHALFTGSTPLQNGGPSCAACHSTGGGAPGLGPDLTTVFVRLGETPLVSACEKTSFKVMDAAYREHPVTRQEALHITRYLEEVAGGRTEPQAPPVGPIGAGAGIAALALIAIGSRGRTPGALRNLTRRRDGGLD